MLRFMDPIQEMERMLTSFGGRWRGGIMPMDAFEKDGTYTMRFDIPGVDADQVDLTVEGTVLRVTVGRTREQTDGVTWLLRERPAGTYRREVRLGDESDTASVEANYDNGVLTVTVPMRPEARPSKVTIGTGDRRRISAGAGS